ncbi:MAG TPA: ATP-binding protein [Pyrinomonadaceae bacterium]|nr:ATP-binding protein [Pyrinomonadaceae bacterium]
MTTRITEDKKLVRVWRPLQQLVLGAVGLALVTLVCFRFQVNSTTVALLYLIVIGLVSLQGSFVPSALVSIIAYICLDAFFTAPLFALGMNQILDIVAPITYVTSAFVVTRLISRLRKSNEQRQQAEETLRKKEAELAHVTRVMTMGEMAASIAHEINQPLAAVVNNASACLRWLSNDSPDLDEAREAAQAIVRDGKRAGDVIARIRAILKKTDPEKGPVDIKRAINDVVSVVRDEAERNRIQLRLDLAEALPTVHGDSVQLQQVILNLVMNSIEATSKTDRSRKILIRGSLNAYDTVLVSVQDSGIGIDSQDVEKIFDAFYTTKTHGLGMGLAISRSIIEEHGGELWARANNGAGMTFQFTLLTYRN